MAICSFGASTFRIRHLNLGSGRPKLGTVHIQQGIRIVSPIRYDGLVISQRSEKALIWCKCSSSEAESTTHSEVGSEEAINSGTGNQLILNTSEVESLLTRICDTTSIAEFELKLGGFRLYVMRDLPGKSSSPPPITAPNTTVGTQVLNGSVFSQSLAITHVPSSDGTRSLINKAADEGLVIIQSPRVGFFRRSRTIKGKRAPPPCKEKQIVKEGQVLCYIEQLGGEIPIESDIAGEVTKILVEDGEPVGYGDALIAILPSFPGIKKLQ